MPMSEVEKQAFEEAIEEAWKGTVVTIEGGLGLSNVTGPLVGGFKGLVKALKANDLKIVRVES